jgi:hypothetical protein
MPTLEEAHLHINNGGITVSIEENSQPGAEGREWALALDMTNMAVPMRAEIALIHPNQVRYMILVLNRTLARMETQPNVFGYLGGSMNMNVKVEDGREVDFTWPGKTESGTDQASYDYSAEGGSDGNPG